MMEVLTYLLNIALFPMRTVIDFHEFAQSS